jgi:hypothetical protein
MALSDVDPRMLERSLRELKARLNERLDKIGTDVVATSKRSDARVNAEIDALGKQLEALQQRINSGETLAARRVENARPKAWKVDVEDYTLTPVLRDGSLGPPIDLKPMFEHFYNDIEGGKRG